jgi:hypothetical protein
MNLASAFIDFKKVYDSISLVCMHVCMYETYGIVWVGKHLCDKLPINNGLKQGVALSPLLFNFVVEYAVRRVRVNQDGLNLNGTHQLLVYANGVNMLGGSVHTVKKNRCFSSS